LTKPSVVWRLSMAAAGVLAAMIPVVGHGMEFNTVRIDSTTVLISASGRIASGDSERLMAAFISLPRDGLNVLALNSAGGSVVASEALAAAIRRVGVRVFVDSNSMCASACFVLFASSPRKFYAPGAQIGVHSAVRGEYETMDSMAVTTAVARSAAEMGVPNAIIGRMVSTPPGSMAWLSEAELDAMGAHSLNPSTTHAPQDTPTAQAVPSVSASLPATQASRRGGVPKDEQWVSFQQGRADRAAWEQWFAALTGDARLGADYWSIQRSKQQPGNCVGTPEFQQTCVAAKRRLATPDTRRKTDAQYWWGWNST